MLVPLARRRQPPLRQRGAAPATSQPCGRGTLVICPPTGAPPHPWRILARWAAACGLAPVSRPSWRSDRQRPPPLLCSAAAADAAVMTEAPKDGSAVDNIMLPEWAGMSYDKQYDDIFSKPLNVRKVTPKPDPVAQAQVGAGTAAGHGALGALLGAGAAEGREPALLRQPLADL